MQIVDFQSTRIRVGRWPASVDVQAEAKHSDNAISATFYPVCSPTIEIREKDEVIKVFVFKFDDHKPITGHWADSNLIWTNVP